MIYDMLPAVPSGGGGAVTVDEDGFIVGGDGRPLKVLEVPDAGGAGLDHLVLVAKHSEKGQADVASSEVDTNA